MRYIQGTSLLYRTHALHYPYRRKTCVALSPSPLALNSVRQAGGREAQMNERQVVQAGTRCALALSSKGGCFRPHVRNM